MNLTMIQEEAPHINWTHYLNGAFAPYIYIPDNAFMVVKNPVLLSNVSQLVSSLDKRTLANYIGWRVILESTSILSEKWAIMGRRVWKKLDDRPKMTDKWKYCVSVIKEYFDLGISSLYVQNLSGGEDSQTRLVKKIVTYIKEAFLNTLETNTWMDDATKKEAINKTHKMTLHVGYPSELLNETAINDFYETVEISRNWTFFKNMLVLRRFDTHREFINIFQYDNVKDQWVYKNCRNDNLISCQNFFYLSVGKSTEK